MEIMVEMYTPSADETYMNARQLSYFKKKLLSQKDDLETRLTVHRQKLKEMKATQPDLLDRSNFLMEMENEIKTQERNSETIRQINKALERIDDGTFGFCEYTGQRIGLRRLEILPFTSFSIRALENLA